LCALTAAGANIRRAANHSFPGEKILDSWWDLGEGVGQRGNELDPAIITCPFCDEEGNFSVEHHAEKKKATSKKTLNFDTLRCGNCAGYVMVLWSAGASWGRGLYGLRVLPCPPK